MTSVDIVHQRRVAAVTNAVAGGNMSETARVFGVSRKTIHGWKRLAETHGMAALRPKDRRRPEMPNATPTWAIEHQLQLAILEPTRGARYYADLLGTDGFSLSKSGVQNLLNRHRLGLRRERVAAAAQLAASHGLVPAEIIEVSESEVVSFFGKVHDPVDSSEMTSAFRTIGFADLVRTDAVRAGTRRQQGPGTL